MFSLLHTSIQLLLYYLTVFFLSFKYFTYHRHMLHVIQKQFVCAVFAFLVEISTWQRKKYILLHLVYVEIDQQKQLLVVLAPSLIHSFIHVHEYLKKYYEKGWKYKKCNSRISYLVIIIMCNNTITLQCFIEQHSKCKEREKE